MFSRSKMPIMLLAGPSIYDGVNWKSAKSLDFPGINVLQFESQKLVIVTVKITTSAHRPFVTPLKGSRLSFYCIIYFQYCAYKLQP